MSSETFRKRLVDLIDQHKQVIERENHPVAGPGNGLYTRWEQPVLTREHVPLFWRYDLDATANPFLMERLGINAVFNSGAIYLDDRFLLVCRVEGVDRKSFFAVAESPSGIDRFVFWDHPITLPETENPDTNVYDMRVVQHADGWIYGIFCTERPDPDAAPGDVSSATAQAGLARTRDLVTWERLPDLVTPSPQQRNVVLHPEFVDGQYFFYTRPQDDFIEAGSGGGIGWGLVADIENPVIDAEDIIDPRVYHTVKEAKNGMGAPPIKTDQGWLHIAHGVRGTAAGLRYVLYAFLCDLDHPERVIARPGGYLLAPLGSERVGDVSNVVFSNGVAVTPDKQVFIYYGSSDTRMHVATSTVDQLLDYVLNTPEDSLRSAAAVQQRNELIKHNMALINGHQDHDADDLLKRAFA